MKRASVIVGLFVSFLARSASAEEEVPEAPPPPPSSATPAALDAPPAAPPPPALRTDLWKISAGPRVGYVSSASYDTFSSNDVLLQWSLEAQAPLIHRGRFALGVGLGYAGGSRSGTLRGSDTSLAVHSLSVPIEARYHPGRWGYGFVRAAPGATVLRASMSEASSPDELTDTRAVFAADVSLGAAILLGPRGPEQAERRTVRVYAIPEVGYTLTTNARLDLRPDRAADDALGTDERTALSSLNLSSFFWRISFGITF